MNGNMLRAPLIKTAALLAVVSLLVYLTATSPGGSLLSSIGTLFVAMIRIVQLSLGLIVSLFFCLVVLTGIFLGCVAMVSRRSASNMVEQLRQQISDKLLYIRSLVITDVPPLGERVFEEYDTGVEHAMRTALEDSLVPIRQDYTAVAEKIESIVQRLGQIEQNEDITSFSTHLERQAENVQGLESKLGELHEQITVIQKTINELTILSRNEKIEQVTGELGDRMSLLEKTTGSLQEDLSRIKEGADAREMHGESDGQSGEEFVEHRLFTHLKKKDVQEKIETLVTETLDKDMSYAQVVDYLVAHAKGETAEIIAAHPSLVKDYIRYRRNHS